jgi:NAD(P)-dependent dehydrogenase (short-subunit alcohol dehydrogenase family)
MVDIVNLLWSAPDDLRQPCPAHVLSRSAGRQGGVRDWRVQRHRRRRRAPLRGGRRAGRRRGPANLRGPFLCIKHQIPHLIDRGGGSIVVTSSIGGLVGGASNSDYAASKWGLAGLVKSAALDYAARNIRINAIAPGPTRSEMFDRWMHTEELRAMMAAHAPLNYIAHPDDMARAALFLLSDEARWTTGCIFPCEGGMSAD